MTKAERDFAATAVLYRRMQRAERQRDRIAEALRKRDRLAEALRALVRLHDEQIFINGEDDNETVRGALLFARARLAELEKP